MTINAFKKQIKRLSSEFDIVDSLVEGCGRAYQGIEVLQVALTWHTGEILARCPCHHQ